MKRETREIPLNDVRVTDGFWQNRQRVITDVTIPYMEKILRDEVPGAEKSHALANFRIVAGDEQGAFYGMVFQDSDVAKWLEAAAYSLYVKPDDELRKRMNAVIDTVARAQQADGYLNTYFTLVEPENRWKNLLECHELYCAGHMIEAACAHYEATGERSLLDVAVRLADHIVKRFGQGAEEGVPGHQEIEIALMRLYHLTGKEDYLHTAVRFLELRGQDGHYFEKHTPSHPGVHYGGYDIDPLDTVYNQSDVPVRDQTKARGHAVRCVYMLTAMADAANATGDQGYKEACERMFESITQRQMYVTGAVGATEHHEAFSRDYDLPNDSGYGETCASVAMVFFARKMLGLEPDGCYADLMELELFNGALAGMQLDGTRFFYVNPLEVDPATSGVLPGLTHVLPERPPWHACACCPPNLARLITSLGKYIWGEGDDTVYLHMLVGSEANTRHAQLSVETAYPWQGDACITVHPHTEEGFTFAVHIPAYAQNACLRVNGEPVDVPETNGYCYVTRRWREGDRVQVAFDMPARRIYADPRVKADAGRVAIARGPLVYCLESVDNGECLSALRLPRDAELTALPYDETLLGGIVPIQAQGIREQVQPTLYGSEPPKAIQVPIRAIPYYAWSNRGACEMCVWVRE